MGAPKARHIKKLAAATLAASFLLSLSPAAPAAATDCEQVNVRAFHIEAKAARPVYVIGEKAVIHTTVTRPAREDPAGAGIELDPPHEDPAPDVNVGVGLEVGRDFLFGFGVTDEKGKVDVEIDLESGTQSGEATAHIYAWKDVVQTPCLTIRDFGFRTYEDMFRVVRP